MTTNEFDPVTLYEGLLKDAEFQVYLAALCTVYSVRVHRVKGVKQDVLVWSAASLVRLARGAAGYLSPKPKPVPETAVGQAAAGYRSGLARIEGVARLGRDPSEEGGLGTGEPGPVARDRCPTCRRFAPATFKRTFAPVASDKPPEVITVCPLCVREETHKRRKVK